MLELSVAIKIEKALQEQTKAVKEQTEIFKRNTRFTFWGAIFTLVGVLLAIFMAFLALKQTHQIEIRGAGTPSEQEAGHLTLVPLLRGTPRGPSKGDISTQFSPYSPQIVQLAHDIIDCESDWRPNVYGDGGRAYGLAQFHKPTWNWLCELYGVDLDYYNPQHQIQLLVMALQDDRGYLWSCWHQLIN